MVNALSGARRVRAFAATADGLTPCLLFRIAATPALVRHDGLLARKYSLLVIVPLNRKRPGARAPGRMAILYPPVGGDQ
jgi:hypothetical protein